MWAVRHIFKAIQMINLQFFGSRDHVGADRGSTDRGSALEEVYPRVADRRFPEVREVPSLRAIERKGPRAIGGKVSPVQSTTKMRPLVSSSCSWTLTRSLHSSEDAHSSSASRGTSLPLQAAQGERDEAGQALVVSKGYTRSHELAYGAGPIEVGVLRIIHTKVRLRGDDGLYCLVMVGAKVDGTKELIALQDGY